MRVLFFVRHNFHTSAGGAQIQILNTCRELEKLGIKCDIATNLSDVDYKKYDLIHLSDLTWVYDLLNYMESLKNVLIPKVLSTIYWPFDDYAANGAPTFQKIIFKIFGINGFEYVKSIAKMISQKNSVYMNGLKRTYISNQRWIVSQIDWLLPNSQLEMDALNQRLNLSQANFSVINNAIDVSEYDHIIANSSIRKNNQLVLVVGRIDPRKNQLALLKALYETTFTIRFIGQAGPNSETYFSKLKNLAQKRGNVEFISQISQDEVFKHMLQAKVHALPSWVETPGLVSLEAAYADCLIVVGDKGSVRDYFRDHAYYCMPNDLQSIRNAVEQAMISSPDQEFKKIIHEQYSWRHTARQTLEAYEHVLKLHKGKKQ